MFLCSLPSAGLVRLEHGAAKAFGSATPAYVVGEGKLERTAAVGVQLCER